MPLLLDHKRQFVASVLNSTKGLDPYPYLSYFLADENGEFNEDTFLAGNNRTINLARPFATNLPRLMLPPDIYREVYEKKTFKMYTENVSVSTLLRGIFSPEIQDNVVAMDRIYRHGQLTFIPKKPDLRPVSLYVNQLVSIPVYDPDHLSFGFGGRLPMVDTPRVKEAVKRIFEDGMEDMVEFKSNLLALMQCVADRDKLKNSIMSSIYSFRTAKRLEEAYPKLAKYIPKEAYTVYRRPPKVIDPKAAPIPNPEIAAQNHRYAIIDSLIEKGLDTSRAG